MNGESSVQRFFECLLKGAAQPQPRKRERAPNPRAGQGDLGRGKIEPWHFRDGAQNLCLFRYVLPAEIPSISFQSTPESMGQRDEPRVDGGLMARRAPDCLDGDLADTICAVMISGASREDRRRGIVDCWSKERPDLIRLLQAIFAGLFDFGRREAQIFFQPQSIRPLAQAAIASPD